MTIGNDISRGVIHGTASGRPSHQTGTRRPSCSLSHLPSYRKAIRRKSI
jgi:hypothetical protein